MKKITLLLLLFAGMANAQLTFTDPQLKAYLLTSSVSNNIALNASLQSIKIDSNSNGQIEAAEAAVVTRLWIEDIAVTNLGGIEGFASLSQLGVKQTGITGVTLPPMPNMANLNFLENASLTNLDVSGMAALVQLSCTDNPQLSSLITLGCNAMTTLIAQNNAITAIDLSGFTNLLNVYLGNNSLTSIDVSGCTNLNGINCTNNNLTAIDVSGLTHLVALQCKDNPNLSAVHAAGCSSMTSIDLQNDVNVTYVDLTGCSSLAGFVNYSAGLATMNLSGCSSLLSFDAASNSLSSLDLTGCTSLQFLSAAGNQLSSIDLSDCVALQQANLSGNQLTSVDTSGLLNLNALTLYNNPLEHLNASGCTALSNLSYDTTGNTIKSFDISGCPLTNVLIQSSLLESVNVQGCTSLTTLTIEGTIPVAPLTTLNLSGLSNLQNLTCGRTSLSSLNTSGCTSLTSVYLGEGNLTSIAFPDSPDITQLTVSISPITTLDVSNFHSLASMHVYSCPLLETIFAKNGALEDLQVDNGNTSLTFICQDDDAVAQTQEMLASTTLTSVSCNSYCSFTPGGDYNTIAGTVLFDLDNNGCDGADVPRPNVKITINDSSETGSTFTENDGSYTFYTGAGSFDLTPAFENQAFFAISPATATVPFADENNNIVTQNFCITASGIHPDVEIAIAPLSGARPGFTAVYQIVIKNKGNQTLSGNYTLAFEDDVLEFVSATQVPASQSTGLLNWNYSNLAPFENRAIAVIMNVNSPTQTPPVNDGDILTFTATVNPIVGDENPSDNQMVFNHAASNSYDPNDIICLEGNAVSPSQIGNYLHYLATFENLGSAEAVNVVVRVDVDESKYDINSLQLLNTSHESYTRVTGNTVEFIFQDINLAPAQGNPPVGGHGNVLFKIKSKNDLVQGDFVDKSAKIYFDYNYPVDTNIAHTIFQTLGNPGFEDQTISIVPNPAKNNVAIRSDFNLGSVSLYDIQGRILQTSIENTNETTIDISNRQTGIYFLKVTSEKGIKVMKLIKE